MSCLYLSHQRFVFIKGTTLTTLTTYNRKKTRAVKFVKSFKYRKLK